MRAALLAVAVLLGGCATASRLDPETAGFALGDLQPATGTLSAEAIYPPPPVSRTFRVAGSEDRVVRSVREVDRFNATRELSMDGVRRDFLALDDAGRLVLTATIDEDEQVFTRFIPPLTVAWPTLAPGVQHEAEAQMQVHELTGRRRLKESGRATRTIRWTGDQVVSFRNREVLAHRIDIEFAADLRMARVLHADVLLVTEDLGPIVIQSRQEVTVLGVIPTVKEQTLVLELEPEP